MPIVLLVDNFHTWEQFEKALMKLNYKFVQSSSGFRNYRGIDNYIIQIPESQDIPIQYAVDFCENRLGIQYRAFLMLIHDRD